MNVIQKEAEKKLKCWNLDTEIQGMWNMKWFVMEVITGTIGIVTFINRTPRYEGLLEEWRYSSTHSLTPALDGGEWSASRPGRFTPKERAPDTHWIGSWVGPRAVLEEL
jgi:hypothetical protein